MGQTRFAVKRLVFQLLLNSSVRSGFLPVNAHGVINILHIYDSISFVLYSCTMKLSNDMHFN